MTEKWVYVNGEKIRIPATPYQAELWGWHPGVRFASFLMSDYDRALGIEKWCRDTFDNHLHVAFAIGVWFKDPKEAMVCQLKWT